MFAAMRRIVDAVLYPIPGSGQLARQRREQRNEMFDLLHRLVGLAMREGVNRAIREAQAAKRGPEDAEDRNAMAKAVEHAHAGTSIVTDLGSKH